MTANSKGEIIGFMLPEGVETKQPIQVFKEYDLVRTLVAVGADGHVVKAGTIGTIVDINKTHDAYEIEFDEPVSSVVTMSRKQIARI